MGAAWSSVEAERWDGSQMPSQAGKVAIVTGANSGIGYFTARGLAEHGAHVVLACRNETKARTAEKEMTEYLLEKSPHGVGKVEFIQLDLADLANVRAFAATIKSRFPCIDLLVNNAGIVMPLEAITVDGVETHFGINHLGPFLLTTLLFELIKKAPAARIVTVGSSSHAWKPPVDPKELIANNWWSWDRYGQSKLAITLFMVELQRRLEAANITNVISLGAHPGVTMTGLSDKVVDYVYHPWLQGFNRKLSTMLPIQGADMGALPTLYAATHPDAKPTAYIGPSGFGRMSGYPSPDALAPHSFDEEAAKRVWALSEELTKTPFEVK